MKKTTELDFDRLRAMALDAALDNATDMPAEELATSRVRLEQMRQQAVNDLAHETTAWLKKTLRTVASLWGGPHRALPDHVAANRDRMARSAQL